MTARRLAEPVEQRTPPIGRPGSARAISARPRIGTCTSEVHLASDGVLDTSASVLGEGEARAGVVGDVSHQLRNWLTELEPRLDELATDPDPSARGGRRWPLWSRPSGLIEALDELLEAARSPGPLGPS